jgi:hypothetical protein
MSNDGECSSIKLSGAARFLTSRSVWPKALLIGTMLCLTGGLGASEADAASAKVRKACAGDYKRLCPRYKVGSSRMRACMEAKQSEISSRCIDALIDSGEVNRRGRRR